MSRAGKIVIFALLLGVQICSATKIHVPGDSATIQSAINGAGNGDTVLVANGTYDEALQFLGKQIVLTSENGAENTRISQTMSFIAGENLNPTVEGFSVFCISCNGGSNPLIQDCIITSEGSSARFPGIQGNSNPVFRRCLFTENYSMDYGGAAYVENAHALFDSCTFEGNYARLRGSAIYAYTNSKVEVVDCIFKENIGAEVGGLDVCCLLCDSLSIKNSITKGSHDWWGGSIAIYQPQSVVIENCTITDYVTVMLAIWGSIGIEDLGSGNMVLKNTIVTRSTTAVSKIYPEMVGSITIENCDFYGNTNGVFADGSEIIGDYFLADPLFCDTANFDYHISDNSSCAPAYSPNGELVGALGVGCSLPYTCGDANNDGGINVSDAIYIINYVFVSGSAWPSPFASADANCDTNVNVSDAVYIINHVFVGGNAPCDTNGDSVPDC